MTNKEAIKYLIPPVATSTIPYNEYLKEKEAYKIAIKALEEKSQGEWIDYDNTFYKCPECGYLLEKCCPQCQNKVILPKGGEEC